MKMTSLKFIEQFIVSEDVKERFQSCILENGRQPEQPRKWHRQLPSVPQYLERDKDADETLWVLISYVGAFSNILFKKCHNLCPEVLTTPVGTQRAIKVKLFYGKSVSWTLYQNVASSVHHKDVEQHIRTFKRI